MCIKFLVNNSDNLGEQGFQKYICFIDYAKAFDCVDHNKMWKILKEMRIPDHFTCLLRNLYAGQEATVRTGLVPNRKGVHQGQGYILSSCLFNLYVEYIMQNARLDEAQVGIKIAERNINNLRYADDTTLMAENEEELKNFLMKVKRQSEKAGLKLNIQKTKRKTSDHGLTFWGPYFVCKVRAVAVRKTSQVPSLFISSSSIFRVCCAQNALLGHLEKTRLARTWSLPSRSL